MQKMSASRWLALPFLALVCFLSAGGSDVGAQPPAGLFGSAPAADAPIPTAGAQPRTRFDRAVLRSRNVIVDFQRLRRSGEPDAGGAATELVLNLFPDAVYAAVLDRIERVENGMVWIGQIPGVMGSSVVLSVEDGVMAGSVSMPEGTYSIRYARPGLHIVAQVDQSALPAELPPIRVGDSALQAVGETAPAPVRPEAAGDDGSLIEVMVLYTAAVTASRGGETAVRTLINLAVSETNTSYLNSGISQRLRLVHAAQVAYTETSSLLTDLENAQRSSGSGLTEVGTLRNTYGADVVSLLLHSPDAYCGIAYFMSTVSSTFAPFAYSVVDHRCASGFTFAHELGHNMGATHDWFVDQSLAPYTYAHGYVNVSARWRTIMAYNDNCSVRGFHCARLLYWSNPAQVAPDPYPADPMGVPGGTSTACTHYNTSNPRCDADDARVLDNTSVTVANFRQAALTITGLQPSHSSPVTIGTAVTWTTTVTGGPTPHSYQFWLFNGSTWSVAQSWSASNTWTWTPVVAGSYNVQVWVRNAGSTATYDAWLGTPTFMVNGLPPLVVTSLVSSVESGAPVGTSVTWTASATGGTPPYTYRFWLFDGVRWTLARDWDGSNSWTWTPTIPGSYYVQAWVRNSGSTSDYDAFRGTSLFTLTPAPPLMVIGLTPSAASGSAVGTPVIWTASASGGVGPYTYQFWLFDGVSWTIARPWDASSSWTWSPTVAGSYHVQVWVRNAGSAAVHDAWLGTSLFIVAGPPPLVVTLVSSAGSGAPVGMNVKWTASATGGTAPYTYQFWLFDGTAWTLARSWEASNSWTWTPTIPASYHVQVWVRNSNSGSVYDAWRGTGPFTVTPPSPLTVTGLLPSAASGSPVGTPVVWTASASGGVGPYTYQFWIFNGVSWTIGRSWSATSSWTWTPTAVGSYHVQVWVRNAGSTGVYDAWRGTPAFLVTSLSALGYKTSPGSHSLDLRVGVLQSIRGADRSDRRPYLGTTVVTADRALLGRQGKNSSGVLGSRSQRLIAARRASVPAASRAEKREPNRFIAAVSSASSPLNHCALICFSDSLSSRSMKSATRASLADPAFALDMADASPRGPRELLQVDAHAAAGGDHMKNRLYLPRSSGPTQAGRYCSGSRQSEAVLASVIHPFLSPCTATIEGTALSVLPYADRLDGYA